MKKKVSDQINNWDEVGKTFNHVTEDIYNYKREDCCNHIIPTVEACENTRTKVERLWLNLTITSKDGNGKHYQNSFIVQN